MFMNARDKAQDIFAIKNQSNNTNGQAGVTFSDIFQLIFRKITAEYEMKMKTSRERPKSAPLLRLEKHNAFQIR